MDDVVDLVALQGEDLREAARVGSRTQPGDKTIRQLRACHRHTWLPPHMGRRENGGACDGKERGARTALGSRRCTPSRGARTPRPSRPSRRRRRRRRKSRCGRTPRRCGLRTGPGGDAAVRARASPCCWAAGARHGAPGAMPGSCAAVVGWRAGSESLRHSGGGLCGAPHRAPFGSRSWCRWSPTRGPPRRGRAQPSRGEPCGRRRRWAPSAPNDRRLGQPAHSLH